MDYSMIVGIHDSKEAQTREQQHYGLNKDEKHFPHLENETQPFEDEKVQPTVQYPYLAVKNK
jgi:hypothetical protein